MNKKTWDLYAPIYKRAMKADQKIYDFMYGRIPEMVRDKEVLELATGPGLLAKHIAPAAKTVLATDYSDGMIAEAKKGAYPENLRFEVADAMALPYKENSFDAVLIANALHIVPDPEKVLSENDRVLKPGGLLIAPNFVEHKGTFVSRVWSRILRLASVRFEHQWSAQEYLDFLKNNGWQVAFSKEMAARIALLYAECERGKVRGARTMRILVIGAGVIGSNLAADLFASGRDVTILARGEWADTLLKNGLVIDPIFSPGKKKYRIPVIRELLKDDIYDVIFAVMRYTQIEQVLCHTR